MGQPRATPLYSLGEEIAHAITHGLGLAASLVGLAVLLVAAGLHGDAGTVVGVAVFGTTLVLLYASSTLYHAIRAPRAKQVFQRLDHAAIFLLIAGTYTPFALVCLRGVWGWSLLAIVWSLAVLGVALEAAVPHRTARFSLLLQLAMGWLAVVAADPLLHSLQPDGVALLVLGGLAYTLGVLFYAWQRLPYNHAVWHVFVLVGSACHFGCVLGYVGR